MNAITIDENFPINSSYSSRDSAQVTFIFLFPLNPWYFKSFSSSFYLKNYPFLVSLNATES